MLHPLILILTIDLEINYISTAALMMKTGLVFEVQQLSAYSSASS